MIESIQHPTLLLDPSKVKRNIQKMTATIQEAGVTFRPHFKTHQSAAIGEWFREAGVDRITVSSVRMAQYFADHGWEDILLAFPVNLRALREINQLAQQVTLGLLVDHPDSATELARSIETTINVWLEVDVGDQRSGVRWEDPEGARSVIEPVRKSRQLRFRGLLAHAGHTYDSRSAREVRQYYGRMVQRMRTLKEELEEGAPLQISVGDTPTASVMADFKGVDEIRPGNFVFYDLMQVQTGCCQPSDIAVVLAAPVVGKYKERQEIVIHGGAVHLSKDYLLDAQNRPIYGKIVRFKEAGWSKPVEGTVVRSLSQEHGIVRCSRKFWESVKIGDVVGVLPIHSCLTANLMGKYRTTGGEHLQML